MSITESLRNRLRENWNSDSEERDEAIIQAARDIFIEQPALLRECLLEEIADSTDEQLAKILDDPQQWGHATLLMIRDQISDMAEKKADEAFEDSLYDETDEAMMRR